MASNILKRSIRPHPQSIKYVQLHPTPQQLFSMESGPGQKSIPDNCREGNGGSVRHLMWDRIFSNDTRLNKLTQDFKSSETATEKSLGELATTMATQFANVGTKFANVDTQFAQIRAEFMAKFAEGKIDSNHLKSKMSFIQWQLGIVGSAMVAFIGFAGYAVKKLMDVYMPQLAPPISAPSSVEDGNVSSEAKVEGARRDNNAVGGNTAAAGDTGAAGGNSAAGVNGTAGVNGAAGGAQNKWGLFF